MKDGPKRRRETQAGRIRAVSSASASSSSYPVKQESTQSSTASNRHSTPTPISGSSAINNFGMPSSTPITTPSQSTASCGGSTSYPTTAAMTSSMYPPQTPNTTNPSHTLRTPTTTTFPDSRYDSARTKDESIIGMLSTPLQGFPNFSTPYSAVPTLSLAHQISEPELVGIRTTTSNLSSIASMI